MAAPALDASSDWSSTQTITIGTNQINNSPSPVNAINASQLAPSAAGSASQTSATPNQLGTQYSAAQSNFDWTEITAFTLVGTIVLLAVLVIRSSRRIGVLERKIEHLAEKP